MRTERVDKLFGTLHNPFVWLYQVVLLTSYPITPVYEIYARISVVWINRRKHVKKLLFLRFNGLGL